MVEVIGERHVPNQKVTRAKSRLRTHSPYRSAMVLVKFPLVPLSLIWLLPKEISEPAVAFTPVALAPMVDAPTLSNEPAELISMPAIKLATRLDVSIVKNT